MSWLAVLLLLGQAAAAANAPLSDPLADAELARHRGGLRLPNGVDLAVTVQTQTAVNGAVILQTAYRVDQGEPTLTISAPAPGVTVPSEGGGAASRATVGTPSPTITFDRMSGLRVTPAAAAPAVTVATDSSAAAGPASGLTQVAPGDVTAAGAVSESAANGIRAVSLKAADLTVTHLTGNAFGSAIVNSGNDRVIDTQTTIAIDLRNFSPDTLGSAMFRVQDIALDAVALRTGG